MSRELLREFFKSKFFHLIILILIGISTLIIFTELILTVTYCDHEPEKIHKIHHILSIITLSFVSFFMFELLVQIYAFGWGWFSKILHIIDLITVAVTLALDIWFHADESLQSVVSVIIILRFWRIVHLVHNINDFVEIEWEEKKHKYERQICLLEEEVRCYKKIYGAVYKSMSDLKHTIEHQKLKERKPAKTLKEIKIIE